MKAGLDKSNGGKIEVIVFFLILAGIYSTSFYSYLLFHSFAELFSVVISIGVFLLAWNSRRMIEDRFFIFIAISLLFTAVIDIVHTLAYKGMGVFVGFDANLPTQLWIAARYLQSVSFLAAIFLINKKFHFRYLYIADTLIIAVLFLSIFYWRNFPACYIEGTGLTPFKKISEYVISAIFLGGALLFLRKSRFFDRSVRRLILASIAMTIASEMAFVHYVSVYGFFNLLGHLFKIVAFYLIYRAIIVIGLTRPYDFLFRRIEQSEETAQSLLLEAKKLSAIIEHTFEAIALIDLGEKNLLRYVNPAWEKLFGYTKEEVVGKRQGLIIEAAKRDPALYKKFLETIAVGGIFQAEMEWQRKNGGLVTVEVFSVPVRDEKGRIFLWFNTIRDITRRKQIEENLKTERARLAEEKAKADAFLENIGEGVIVVDRDERVITVNRAAEEMLGIRKESEKGKKYFAVWEAQDSDGNTLAPENRPMTSAFAGGKKVISSTLNPLFFVRKDASRFPVAIAASPVIMDGQVIGAIVVFRDISREYDVNKTKSEFISVASHQLRTPLTGIKWFAELLRKKEKISPAQENYLRQIEASNERMIRLVDDLLNVSRIETGQKYAIVLRKVDMAALIREAVKEAAISGAARKVKLKLTRDFPKKLPVNADEDKMRQVFQNLVDNAVKYSKVGGLVAIGCTQNKSEAVFYIRDGGIGIPRDQQHRVFQKFFRAGNAIAVHTGGTGLGLYIARAIVEGHGGKIWFESEENKGATFYVSLPLGA